MNRGSGKLAGRIGAGVAIVCVLLVILIGAGFSVTVAVLSAWIAGAAIIPATVWAFSYRECRVRDCTGVEKARSMTPSGADEGLSGRSSKDEKQPETVA